MSKLVPLGRNVVIQDRVKETKQGQIHIPDSAQEKSYEAVIVALGPDVPAVAAVAAARCKFGLMNETASEITQMLEVDQLDSNPRLKVGDVVIYGKFAGDEVTVNGEKYRLLKDTDILAKIV